MSRCRAIHAFQAQQPGDLSFNVGEIIYVLDRPGTGWWLGRTEDERQGVFPFNHVVVEEEPSPLDQFVTNSNEPPADKINSIDVKIKDPIPKYAQEFEVSVVISNGSFAKAKLKMSDFRVLCEALNYVSNTKEGIVGLDRSERTNTEIPRWADNILLTSYFANQKMRDRASILSEWLRFKIGQEARKDYLIATCVQPGIEFTASDAVKKDAEEAITVAKREMKANGEIQFPEVAKALYKWPKQDDQDISLEKDEHLAIWEDSEFAGWWIGEKVNGDRGLFPHNYVQKLAAEEKHDFFHPEEAVLRTRVIPEVPSRPQNTATFETNFGLGSKQDTNNYKPTTSLSGVFGRPGKTETHTPRQRQKVSNYKLCCTEAFDQLLNDGVTIEEKGSLARFDGLRDTPSDGDIVTLYYSGYIWEPQKQELLEFASSDKLVGGSSPSNTGGPLEFTIGANQAIDGLEEAVQKMTLGQSVRITLRPDKAYQEVGFPPDIPGNAFLVYDVTLERIQRSNGAAVNAVAAVLNNQGAMRSTVMNRGPSARNINPVQGFQQGAGGFGNAGGGQNNTSGAKFTLEQLQKIVQNKSHAEHGIDPTRVEDYLREEDFVRAFNVEYSKWLLLTPYNKKEKKKQAALF